MSLKDLFLVLVCGLACAGQAGAQDSSTLRKIRETGIITIGFRDSSIPFSYLDRQQRPIGYSIDLCHKIVDALKERLKLPALELQFRPVTSANRIALVANGIVDIECGSTSNTLERQKSVGFSVTTFVALSSLMSKKPADIQSLQELRGQVVASTAGTTSIKALAELNRARGLDMQIVAGKDHADAFQLLESGRAAAFVMDDVLLYGLAASARKPADYVIASVDLSVDPYGIMLPKNDPEFKKIADQAIVELFRSGEINQLYQKWFLTPIPPNKIQLQLPMSAVLRRVIANPTDSGNLGDYR